MLQASNEENNSKPTRFERRLSLVPDNAAELARYIGMIQDLQSELADVNKKVSEW